MLKKILSGAFLGLAVSLISCNDDEPALLPVPQTYEFTRDGQSTVSYQGQTDRLNMLSEIKTYIKKGDNGETVDAQILLDMYANENNQFTNPDLNASSKQLKNKTFIADVEHFESLFANAATVSAAGTVASQGQGGLIQRSNGSNILVNEKGWEFTQFVEKGLMGAVFYNQIFNSYLSDAKTGDDVENTALVAGKNYTPMEHHWDEAFGYLGVPVDFPQGDPVLEGDEKRFWANYTNSRDALLGVNQPLMNAYMTGRTAIVNKTYDIKNEQKAIIYDLHELVAAATAVHYINKAIDNLAAEEMGDFLHHVSEGYAFVKAISYSPDKKLTNNEINQILTSDFGTNGDFWTATISGLQNAKATIASKYPEINTVKDQL